MRSILVSSACFAFFFATTACSGAGKGATSSAVATDAGDGDAVVEDAGAGVDAASIIGYDGPATAHGVIIDYFTLKPMAGLVVAANGATSTTDENGMWTLTVPGGSVLTPSVTGTGYAPLIFPETVPAAADMDFGSSVIGTTNAFQLEQGGLGSAPSKGVVQVVLRARASCKSVDGATIKVLAPSGAIAAYFDATGLPDPSLTVPDTIKAPRPVAVVYNVAPGSHLDVRVDHPTCKQVAFPLVDEGRTYTGQTTINAAEPGDYSSALVLFLE
jgi:hypothetical protein